MDIWEHKVERPAVHIPFALIWMKNIWQGMKVEVNTRKDGHGLLIKRCWL